MNMGNALNTLSNTTKEDTKLYNCIKELYEQGVPFDELKALIPDMKRTREQLRIKRMLENNNEMLVSMLSKEMSLLLDAKERRQEDEFRKLDQLIRQQQTYRKESARINPAARIKKLLMPT
jgi:DNA-binding transcriptional MerR regulator